MKIEKTKDNWEGRQSERIHEYLDQNVSIVDLNTGPTEFSEVWCGIIGRNNRYSQREVILQKLMDIEKDDGHPTIREITKEVEKLVKPFTKRRPGNPPDIFF